MKESLKEKNINAVAKWENSEPFQTQQKNLSNMCGQLAATETRVGVFTRDASPSRVLHKDYNSLLFHSMKRLNGGSQDITADHPNYIGRASVHSPAVGDI